MWGSRAGVRKFFRGLSARFFEQSLNSELRPSSETRVTEGAAPEGPSFCSSLNKSEEERLFAVYPAPREIRL